MDPARRTTSPTAPARLISTTGRPLGDKGFVKMMGDLLSRDLPPNKPGPKPGKKKAKKRKT